MSLLKNLTVQPAIVVHQANLAILYRRRHKIQSVKQNDYMI